MSAPVDGGVAHSIGVSTALFLCSAKRGCSRQAGEQASTSLTSFRRPSLQACDWRASSSMAVGPDQSWRGPCRGADDFSRPALCRSYTYFGG